MLEELRRLKAVTQLAQLIQWQGIHQPDGVLEQKDESALHTGEIVEKICPTET